MDVFDIPVDIMSMASLVLLMVLNTHRALSLSSAGSPTDDACIDFTLSSHLCDSAVGDVDAFSRAALHHWRLWNSLTFLDADLGYWVKPRSTTWFSRFLLYEYNDDRWVQIFRMTKRFVFSLATLLSPCIRKRDTNYQLAIPVPVRLACTLFKLSQGASLIICSEMFAVGRSTVSIMLREVVQAINVVLRTEISWSAGERAATTAAEFQQLCGLPGIMGAIDGTHIAISKPRFGAADYYYFKSAGYTINCQDVVDSSKRFLDLYVGMPGKTNDSRMLRRSTLFHRGQHRTLWDNAFSMHGFSPYLLGDGGYPLLPWLMVPHRQHGNLAVAEALFNRKLSRGRAVVENAFGLLKLSFRELGHKTDLHVTIVPDVVTCCCILHNVLLKQSHEDVERLLEVLRTEEGRHAAQEAKNTVEDGQDVVVDDVEVEEAQRKRRELGTFLTMQRIVPF